MANSIVTGNEETLDKETAPQGVGAPNGATKEVETNLQVTTSGVPRQSENVGVLDVAPNSQGTTLNDALDVVRQHFGTTSSVVLGAEACISAMCSLLLAEADCCMALVLEGPASSGKTTALNFLRSNLLSKGELVVPTDSFTPAAFVSHAANRTAEQLDKNDLLPRIRHKGLIVPDLAPTFSAREEDLAKNVGILTRVLDGQGYESDSGTHGHRGHVGDYRFTLLAATTPLTATAWGIMGRVGNRIVMLETGSETVTTDDLVASMTGSVSYTRKVQECTVAVSEFLLRLWKESGGYGAVPWDAATDRPDLVRVVAQVAQWVVRCRGSVAVEPDDFGGGEHAPVHVEAPHRLCSALYNLAKGHALAYGRRKLALEDVQLAVRVGLDSMPIERRRVVRALLRSESGELTSAQVELVLDRSRPTARKVMEALDALGAVAAGKQGTSQTISLLESERWLLEGDNRWALARLPAVPT